MSKHGLPKEGTSNDRGSADGETDGRVSRRLALGAISVSGLGLALAATAIGPAASAQQVTQSRRERGIVGQLAPPLALDFWIDKDGQPT